MKETLESVSSFHEVIVADTGSTDETVEIAKSFPNVKIEHLEFNGFGSTHNEASRLASNDWIFSLDSDEVLSPELVQELQSLKLDPNAVYSFARHNYFNGKHIKSCSGWHPDWIVRLYNRKMTSFSNDLVHEKVETKNLKLISLHSPIRHTPYRHVGDFLTKMQTYSNLFAEQHRHKRSSSFGRAVLHGWFAFFRSYIFKRGVLNGKEGFIISLYIGQTTFYKYLKLAELNKSPS